MTNYEKLAELLGVPMDREFKIGDNCSVFKITKTKFLYSFGKQLKWSNALINVNHLLESTITLLPWKPKDDETYYIINPYYSCGYLKTVYWSDSNRREVSRVEVYQTETEAIEAVKKLGWVVEKESEG